MSRLRGVLALLPLSAAAWGAQSGAAMSPIPFRKEADVGLLQVGLMMVLAVALALLAAFVAKRVGLMRGRDRPDRDISYLEGYRLPGKGSVHLIRIRDREYVLAESAGRITPVDVLPVREPHCSPCETQDTSPS